MFRIITVIFKGTLLSSRSSFSAFPILFGKARNEKLKTEYSTLKMVIFGLKFDFVTKLLSTFQKDHFLICHQAVARCILGILLNLPKEEIPHIEIPLHTVLKLENGKLSYEKII